MKSKFNDKYEKEIKEIVIKNRSLRERFKQLLEYGYTIKRCYVPTYNRLLGKSIVKKEMRIIVGRPANHYVREVYAVIFTI